MKKNIILFILVILSLNSCSDALDIVPEGQYSLDEIFATEVTTGAYLNSCYDGMPEYGFKYNYATNAPIAFSDDAWVYTTNKNCVAYYYGGMSSNRWKNRLVCDALTYGKGYGVDTNSWSLFWRNIRRCNIFLDRIKTAAVPSETERNHWTAEIMILRAYYYFELASRFGDLPLITQPLSADDSGSTLVKEPFSTIAKFIISECEDVINNYPDLPWRSETSLDAIRMTKGVAAILKSRASIWMASPLFNKGENYWAEAERVTKESLESCLENGYKLYTDVSKPSVYGDNAYSEFFITPQGFGSSSIDQETIWATINNQWQWIFQNNSMPLYGAMNIGICPTQELVDAYPMKDGTYVLSLDKPYNDERHLSPNYNPSTLKENNGLYDPQNPYLNRDPRFYATVYYNGSTALNKKQVKTVINIYDGGDAGIIAGQPKRTCTGYYHKKYIKAEAYQGLWAQACMRLMRLGELYLNYAEAAAENNHIDKAKEAILPIRNRVHMPNIDPHNQHEAIMMVRQERRIEMALEENRYGDMRRWTSPSEDMENGRYLTGMWIVKNGSTFEYHRFQIGDSYNKKSGTWAGTGFERDTYKSKYLLQGLIDEEANRLRAATGEEWQNPGWN